MKRSFVAVVTFLLLGAVATVGVAWAFGLFVQPPGNSGYSQQSGFSMRVSFRELPRSDRDGPRDRMAPEAPTHWIARRIERSGVALVVVTGVLEPRRPRPDAPFESLLPPIRGLEDDLRRFEQHGVSWDSPTFLIWDGRGWPFIAMACQWPWWSRDQWPQPVVQGGLAFGSPTDQFWWPYGVHELRALPLTPYWPGFAVNTLFFATILSLLGYGSLVARRVIRRRRGQCPKCGYPIGESAVCSECGRELPRRAGVAT